MSRDSWSVCLLGSAGTAISLAQVQALVGILAAVVTIVCTVLVTRKKLRSPEETERWRREREDLRSRN